MKNVAIMCRVSSDEQAKGYSLDAQYESLTRYCERKGYNIVYTIREDHSAKTFNRPEWKKWTELVKKKKLDVDELLFTSWDRFSRNFPEAISMIYYLKDNLKIMPQAIEQPIDFNIPENLYMLSLYVASPDVDNQNRAKAIKKGVRQSLKQGRWVRAALIGYKNSRDERNKPILTVDEKAAPLIRYAYEAYANGKAQIEIRKELAEKGLVISKSNFGRMLRRIEYTGKIVVPAFDDEPEQLVEGVHPAIVPEDLFLRVQRLLNNNRKGRNHAPKITTKREEFPLRGHLNCSNCGNKSTASASRGKLGKRYFYYHCNHCKEERYPSKLVNQTFEDLLGEFEFKDSVHRLYNKIVMKLLSNSGLNSKQEIITLNKKLQTETERLENLQDYWLDEKISLEEYQEMKIRYSGNIDDIKARLAKLKQSNKNIETYLSSGLSLLQNLKTLYKKAPVALKQRIISSIFPENLCFDGNHCRTPKLNEAILLLLNVDKSYSQNKKGQLHQILQLSPWVEPEGFEPSS